MKLSVALRTLRTKQSQLARKYKLRSNNFLYPKDGSPDVVFDAISQEITSLIEEIDALKCQIQATNSQTMIPFEGRSVSLMQLILMIGNIRSELKQLSSLESPRSRLFSHDDEKDQKPQKTPKEINDLVESLENRKDAIDQLLQFHNHQTELLNAA